MLYFNGESAVEGGGKKEGVRGGGLAVADSSLLCKCHS